jgi:hypothetical protein
MDLKQYWIEYEQVKYENESLRFPPPKGFTSKGDRCITRAFRTTERPFCFK